MPIVHDGDVWPSDSQSFQKLLSRHEPTVFRGLAANWLPVGFSDDADLLDWLSGHIGGHAVPISVGFPGNDGFVGTTAVHEARALNATVSGKQLFRQVTEHMKQKLRMRSRHLVYMQSAKVKICQN